MGSQKRAHYDHWPRHRFGYRVWPCHDDWVLKIVVSNKNTYVFTVRLGRLTHWKDDIGPIGWRCVQCPWSQTSCQTMVKIAKSWLDGKPEKSNDIGGRDRPGLQGFCRIDRLTTLTRTTRTNLPQTTRTTNDTTDTGWQFPVVVKE